MASPETTRLLVLGVVKLFEPANGYQLRRELLSWDVESWANINPGSIYSMLVTLTKQGLVERFDLTPGDGPRTVAVYRITKAGVTELVSMVKDGIRTVGGFDRSHAYAAMSLMPLLLTRKEVLPLFESRQAATIRLGFDLREKLDAVRAGGSPPHVATLLEYSIAVTDAELSWLDSVLERIRGGELVFRGDPEMDDWAPAAGDPGWRMMAEREQYLRLIEERGTGS